MKRVIVTGAGGFLGRALTEALAGAGCEVLALGRGDLSPLFARQPTVQTLKLDLAELGRLPELAAGREFDVFYHFAWTGTSGPLRADSAVQLQNVQWTVEAVEAARAMGCARFVGAGSMMEEEILAAGREPGLAPEPGHIYSAAKLAAHLMSKCAAAGAGIEHVWGKITNIYGPGERSMRLIQATLQKLVRGETPAFTAGTQNYDFLYLTDAAAAFVLLGARARPFCSYVVGSGGARPLRDFLQELRRTLCPAREFSFGAVPFAGKNLPLSCFDTGPLRADTGFAPAVPFSEGIEKTMTWVRETYLEGGGNG